MNPAYRYEGTVIRVVDGDTIDIRVDLGFYMEAAIRFRVYGIDTPEIRGKERPEGLVAKSRVEELLSVGDGKCVVESRKTGKFGRWLGVIYNADGVDVGGQLVIEKLAEPYMVNR